MRVALIAFASVFLMSVAQAAKPAKSPNSPIVFKMTPEKASELIRKRTGEIEELTTMRDDYCARADEACASTFDDVTDGRVKERGALERIRKLLEAGDSKEADKWIRRYNILNVGYTAMLNDLTAKYVVKK